MHHRRNVCVAVFSWVVALTLAPTNAAAGEFSPRQIADAFAKSHDGYSTDEVMIDDQRRAAFLAELTITAQHPDSTASLDQDTQRDVLLELLKLRKAGKLTTRATRRGPPVDDDIAPVAEIAARVVTDRHRISTDAMLADPRLRKELQHEAELIRPGVDAYAVRKSILGLRKKRALKPELVLQVAQWGRQIQTLALEDLKQRLADDSVSDSPGVYLFRTDEGYLYVGEAKNLASRLNTHVGGSDRESLADYLAGQQADGVTVELHIFDKSSPAKRVTVRRAYESELIRSRHPKFNVRP